MTQQPYFPSVGPPAPPLLRCFNPTCRHTWYQRGSVPPHKCPNCQSRHWYDPSYRFRTNRTHTELTELRAPLTPRPPDQEATRALRNQDQEATHEEPDLRGDAAPPDRPA